MVPFSIIFLVDFCVTIYKKAGILQPATIIFNKEFSRRGFEPLGRNYDRLIFSQMP